MSQANNTSQKEAMFSPKNRKLLTNPLSQDNPITVQVLGICSVLAVTVKLKPSIVLALAVFFVMGASNVVISILRKTIPPRIRIIVQLTVIATMVILVDQVLRAYVYDVSRQLSVFVGLIITNCIVMGRLEAYAMGNKIWPSFVDGIGNAAGYAAVIVAVAFFRELLGSGTLMGFQVVPQFLYDFGYVNNGFMILPPMALITVGIIIWVHRARNPKLVDVS